MQPENFNKEAFCRMCLNIISSSNSEATETVLRQILKVVLPDLILEEEHKHQMCKACSLKLFTAFNFKSICTGTENIICSHMNSSQMSLVDLKDLYLVINENIQLTDTWENQRICRLCIQCVTNGFVSLNEVDNDIIDGIIPQVNINATKDPVICGSCFDLLRIHGGFVKNCREVQGKYQNIDKLPYVKTEDIELEDGHDAHEKYRNADEQPYIRSEEMKIKSEDQDNLDEDTMENKRKHISKSVGETKCEYKLDSLHTTEGYVKNVLEAQEKYQNVDNPPYIKTEEIEIKLENAYDVRETYKNIEEQAYIKSEEMEIQSEEEDQDNDSSSHTLVEETIEERKMQISEDIGETKDECMLICGTEAQINKRETPLDISSHGSSEIKIYKCSVCDYKTKRKDHLNTHQLRHKDPSEIQMYKCDICKFQTKYISSVKSHLLLHKGPSKIQIYKCDTCTFETRYKNHLKDHQLLIHPSEICMYSDDDDEPDHNAKHKGNLKSHQLTHKDPSEIQMYKCGTCTYKTKHKKHLKNHLLAHKQFFMCDMCDFATRRKCGLEYHQLKHKDPSEIQMYRCDECDYQSRRKYGLKRHQLIHKDPSEIQMYKCNMCDYAVKHKGALKNHQRKHKNSSEVQMYKCDTCTFETVYKNYLKDHQLTHANTLLKSKCTYVVSLIENKQKEELKHQKPHKFLSNIRLYKCDVCDHESKRKCDLKKHQLIHKDPSEVRIYKCTVCDYKAKQKSYLRNHKLTHKDPSEIKMYKCDVCTFQSKYKNTVKMHELIHRDPSEIQTYRCDKCDYKTIYKRNLKIHQSIHDDPSEIHVYKCDICTFGTKYKALLRDHRLTHTKILQKSKRTGVLNLTENKHKGDLKHQLTHKDLAEIPM